MKSLKILFILGFFLSTNLITAQYTLTLNLTGMDDYIGHRFEVRVTELPSGKEVGRKTIESLESDSVALLLYVFLQGRSYNVDFYADVNDNGGYDVPPTDHSWRRIIINAGSDILVDFSPDPNYINIGFPEAFQYSQYQAIWGGKWKNLTFGSTDSIMASFQLRCDSVFGMFMTKGVFGNPAPVTFNYAEAVPPDGVFSDTIRYTVPTPWAGEVIVVNGDIIGNISLAGTGLTFNGTLGEKQILCLYTVVVGGNPFANGYFYVRELNIESSEPPIETQLIPTNPSCPGSCDGNIEIIVIGGAGPDYHYSWIDTPGGGFCAGEYTLMVTDFAGCTDVTSVMLTDPATIQINLNITQPDSGQNNGSITVMASGGIPPLVYILNDGPPQASNIFNGLSPGEHEVCVEDVSGCMVCGFVILQEISRVEDLDPSFSFYPNPVSDEIHIDSDIPLSATLLDLNGRILRETDFNTEQLLSIEDIQDGMYVLKISDGEKSAYRKIVKAKG